MRGVGAVLLVVAAVLAASCSAETDGLRQGSRQSPERPAPIAPSSTPAEAPGREESDTEESGPEESSGRPVRAWLSIPALDLSRLLVVPYRGRTDDEAGTRIQDRGRAAAPYGPHGGTGPGGVGNYQVTAHRTSSTRAFEFLPRLREGAAIFVDTGRVRYVYRVVTTRTTSFRSPLSLARQRAPVPGRPGEEPRRAMITLSTCLTPEDHAAGNFWADRFGNPEHRVDKIGVLVRTESVRGPAAG